MTFFLKTLQDASYYWCLIGCHLTEDRQQDNLSIWIKCIVFTKMEGLGESQASAIVLVGATMEKSVRVGWLGLS